MKKHIAFLEFETHAPLLEQWYLLLKEMQLLDYHFFVSKKVANHLQNIPQKHITVLDQIADFKSQIRHFDAVVVNTFHRHFDQYHFIFRQKPSMCLVHNMNFSVFFNPLCIQTIFKEKNRLTYYLKLYIKEKIDSKRKNILHFTQLAVLSKALHQELISKNALAASKTVCLNLNFCETMQCPPQKPIKIVISGNISNKRKDIDLIISVLEELNPENHLEFEFLGKPENTQIEKKLIDLETNLHPNVRISYHQKYIQWDDYQTAISKAHLLLCPIKQQTSFYWVKEKYGHTKMSGNENDCIVHGKLGLFPSYYPKMEWHNLFYENKSDLIEILNHLSSDYLQKEYKILQNYNTSYQFNGVKNQLENQLLTLASLPQNV